MRAAIFRQESWNDGIIYLLVTVFTACTPMKTVLYVIVRSVIFYGAKIMRVTSFGLSVIIFLSCVYPIQSASSSINSPKFLIKSIFLNQRRHYGFLHFSSQNLAHLRLGECLKIATFTLD